MDDTGALSGDKSSSNRVAGPPVRPPPPKTSSMYASPAKSAFDDLNDSIRTALTSGSPIKSSGGFRSVEPMGQQHVAGMMYSTISSSSFQQHAFAPLQQSQTMHSSPVQGNVQSVSSNNGGGSQLY